ncbi:zinc finger protein constans [Quercus suber]|uniref:Zinc finger protein constans n=1 Tax=Quercus suber TaxID=58331 RepID=A0AAW0J7L0_QUESU
MLKLENNDGGSSSGGDNNWARICDTCRSAACTVYCRADSAYLCTGCDARIHAANRVHLATSACGFARHVSVPRRLLYVKLMRRLFAPPVMLISTQQTRLHAATTACQFCLFPGTCMVHMRWVPCLQQQQQHYCVPQKSYGGDSVVPVQCGEAKGQPHHLHQQNFQLGLDYESSKAAYSYNGSISHS